MDSKRDRYKPELLAPAGNPEIALAAFDAGADAVYCGLSRFSARARAANFSASDLGRVIDFAHENEKKVYLAFNTLVWESELPDAVRTLSEAAAFLPDALIVQDWGILKLCRERFPQIPLHASTQMGLHNSPGIAFLKRLGVKRAILERQLTMEELKALSKTSPLELEVFIHGSLCCSLSGKCLLSAALFGASGNRGECRQPCRNRYDSGHRRGTFLSPADLNGTDLLEELCRMRIASLKIEGRLRTPDYVWKTCRAYRLLLDHPNDPDARKEADSLLNTTPSRQNSIGFYDGGKNLVNPDRPGIFGHKTGIVEKVTPAGLKIRALDRIHVGDRLRLVSDKPGTDSRGFLLMRLFNGHSPVSALRTGENGFIAGDFAAAEGAVLYKIGENGFDFSRRLAALPDFREKIRLEVSIQADRICVRTGTFAWEKKIALSPAQNRSLTPADVEAVFLSGGLHDRKAESVQCRIDGNLFCPVSVLKNLRREFWDAFSELPKETVEQIQNRTCNAFLSDWEARKTNPAELPEIPTTPILPDFVPENRLPDFQSDLSVLSAQPAACVNSPHQWELLKQSGYTGKIHLVYPIPVTNSEAAELFRNLGAYSAAIDPEVPVEEQTEMRMHTKLPLFLPEPLEQFPLLRSRIPLPEGNWKGSLCVKYSKENGLWELWKKHHEI